jgi:hypothetical protein
MSMRTYQPMDISEGPDVDACIDVDACMHAAHPAQPAQTAESAESSQSFQTAQIDKPAARVVNKNTFEFVPRIAGYPVDFDCPDATIKTWQGQNRRQGGRTMDRVTFYGKTFTVQEGSEIYVDGWEPWASPLLPSDWKAARYRISTQNASGLRGGPIKSLACNVTITGRTPQTPFGKGGADCVRVKIEFVGDGEPSTFISGWMRIYFHGK